jgi:hypothetical protein
MPFPARLRRRAASGEVAPERVTSQRAQALTRAQADA